MIAIVAGVPSTRSLPGLAWSPWPCVTTARGTGIIGAMWKPPGSEWSPAGVGLITVSGRGADIRQENTVVARLDMGSASPRHRFAPRLENPQGEKVRWVTPQIPLVGPLTLSPPPAGGEGTSGAPICAKFSGAQ